MTLKQNEYISYCSPYLHNGKIQVFENPTRNQIYFCKNELGIEYLTEVVYSHPNFGQIIYQSASLERVHIKIDFHTPIVNAYCLDSSLPDNIGDLMIELGDKDFSDIPIYKTLPREEGFEILIYFWENKKFPSSAVFNVDLPKSLIE